MAYWSFTKWAFIGILLAGIAGCAPKTSEPSLDEVKARQWPAGGPSYRDV